MYQVKNPKTGMWVKMSEGKIVSSRKTKYKKVPEKK